MGQPKKSRKNYSRPKKPFDKERLTKEKKVMKEFGLRRKHEAWKAESKLRDFRRRARELLTKEDEKKKRELFDKLNKIGLKVQKLDDILDLKLEDILSRRLQTFIFKKGIGNSLNQSRQLIVHRHVLIDDKKVWYPGYMIKADEEDKITLDEKMKQVRKIQVNAAE